MSGLERPADWSGLERLERPAFKVGQKVKVNYTGDEGEALVFYGAVKEIATDNSYIVSFTAQHEFDARSSASTCCAQSSRSPGGASRV